MTEPQEQEYRRIAEIFCAGYNREHNTLYKFSHVNPEPDDADFFLKDETGNTLPIQHTRCEHVHDFIKRECLSRPLIADLRALLDGQRITNCIVHIVFSHFPRGKDQRQQLIRSLYMLVFRQTKYSSGRCELHRGDLQFLETAFKWLKSVSISQCRSCGLTIGFSWSDVTQPKPLDAEADDLLGTVAKKGLRYGTSGKRIVLLLHSCPIAPDHESVQRSKVELSNQPPPFREVWVVNEANEGFCERLWPSVPEED